MRGPIFLRNPGPKEKPCHVNCLAVTARRGQLSQERSLFSRMMRWRTHVTETVKWYLIRASSGDRDGGKAEWREREDAIGEVDPESMASWNRRSPERTWQVISWNY